VSCPNNPPAPAGWRVWRKPVPTPLTQWAMDLRDHINASPYATTWTTSYNGETVLARKDYHTWTNRKQADGSIKLVTGICIPGITLYETVPAGYAATAQDGDVVTPDENAAMYGADDVPQTIAWPLVVATGTAIVATVAAFLLAIKLAGRPRLP
jgi:hypothetical protein